MPDSRTQHREIPCSGKLITAEPASIGQNFRQLTNMRYTDTHVKSIQGMTKINNAVMHGTYFKARNAFHFRKSQPAESHVIVQAFNAALTASDLLDNPTTIPNAGAFSSSILWPDASSANGARGRFSEAPDGQMIYANGVDNCIWGGNEMACGAVVQSTVALAAATDTTTNPKDVTDIMNNTKSDSANIITLGGSYKTVLIGSPRPIKGMKAYVLSANTTANTLTVKESTTGVWNSLTVLTDTTRVAGKSFAQTGSITFVSTINSTKPKYLEGYYQYWYEITIDAGSAEIYHITLNAPFQRIVDMWDGIYRDIERFYVYLASQRDDSTKVFRDDYDSSLASTYSDISSLAATTQYLEIGFFEKQTGLYFVLPPDYVNSHAAAVAAQGTITMSGIATPGQTFTIDTQTFTWAALRSGTGEVTVGISAAAAVTNLVTAITADLDTVTAVDSTGDTVLVTAVTAGSGGNSIVFADVNSANMAVDGAGYLGGTTVGVNGGLASIDYWNGSAYVTVGDISDGTATSGVSLTKSGVISWNNTAIASEQKKQYANSEPLYYYRVKFDQDLDSSVRINYVGGMSAPKEITHFKFPVFAQGRVLLCCDMAGKKNKAICSSKFMPQVYNGVDSVDIYFGEEGELTCGTELFSLFGASLYSLILMFKDHETWVMAGTDIEQWENNTFLLSSSIGCPAPLTLKTINLHAEPGAGINRALAIWRDANGIYMSDGRAPIPIHGDIKEYFDPSNALYLDPSLIGDSFAFVDPVLQEYHFCSDGVELIYDIARNKWTGPVERGADLQCGVTVHDAVGNGYTYGFLDTGYMERLEYGTDFDGIPISWEAFTGDMALAGLGAETRLSACRMIAVAKSSGDMTVTHYADSAASGTVKTMSLVNSGKRIARPKFVDKLDAEQFHALKIEGTGSAELLAAVISFHPTYADS